MRGFGQVALCALIAHCALAVKVKVVMHSEQDDSKLEDEETHTETWNDHRKKDVTMLPFINTKHVHKNRVEDRPEKEYKNRADEKVEKDYEVDEKTTTEKATHQLHPNEMIFPLIYRQSHINSMFKFGENWYTWSTEKRTDGSKATNYYICYDEPKHCDDIGWERTDALPKCAFQIDSLLPDDRACINSFGVEPHNTGSVCDGAEQMKVADMVRSCGPRIRSLWRFLRVGRRPANAQKPADVNSLICEDEEECYITIEYRIHHDRITFSLHEPTRGQTFKSALKRDVAPEEEKVTTEPPHIHVRKSKKRVEEETQPPKTVDEGTRRDTGRKKIRNRARKLPEGKGVVKERNESSYNRRAPKNKIKVREDVSEDISE